MPWETYQVVPPTPPPDPTWGQWSGAGAALLLAMVWAIVLSRKHLRRRPPLAPMPDPSEHALRALAAIPGEWPVDSAAAAGARVLRAYLGAVGMGPGPAHPARSFSGLRAAQAWRDLTNLLVELEELSCRPQPKREHWDEARALAVALLTRSEAPVKEGGTG